MTLANTLLEKLTEWRPASGRETLHVDHAASGWSVTLLADRSDELGCLVWELKLFRSFGAEGDVAALRGWADRLADRVTGLNQTLKVIEIDAERHEGLLRNEAPLRRAGKLFYHEVFLKGTRKRRSAAIRPHRATANASRSLLP